MIKKIKNDKKVTEEQADNEYNIALSRRSLLKVFATSGISKAIFSSSPLVAGMMFARHSEAMAVPNKAVAIYVPGGAIHKFWVPTGSGSNLVLGSMSAQYESIKTQCNFLKNMGHPAGGHGQMPLILSQGYNGDTFDVFMGKQLGGSMPFRYVNLGVHSNGQGILTRAGSTQISFQDNPFNAFKLLFGDGNSSSNSKDAILQVHTEAAKKIKSKLAGYEVRRLDEHIAAIAEVKDRLDNTGGSCNSAPNNSPFELTYETFTRQAKLQADILVAALKCNLTRSGSLAFGNHQGEFRIPELNYKGNYHQSIHGGSDGQPNYPYYVEMRAHLGGLSAYFINKLQAEGLLDSTVVVEVTDMGHADLHGKDNVPMMIAGGGSVINKATITPGNGFTQHDMLHTAAKACGVSLGYGREIPGILA